MEFDESDGNAMFVSHQWAGIDHPDPKLEQFKVGPVETLETLETLNASPALTLIFPF